MSLHPRHNSPKTQGVRCQLRTHIQLPIVYSKAASFVAPLIPEETPPQPPPIAVYSKSLFIRHWNMRKYLITGKLFYLLETHAFRELGKLKLIKTLYQVNEQLIQGQQNVSWYTAGFFKNVYTPREGRRPLGRNRRRWEDNIKMD